MTEDEKRIEETVKGLLNGPPLTREQAEHIVREHARLYKESWEGLKRIPRHWWCPFN